MKKVNYRCFVQIVALSLIDLNVPVTERRQRVKLGSCSSNWRTINGGVLQGTVLGPVLLLVMINDPLDEWPDQWKYIDDSTAAESVMPVATVNSKIF